MHAVGGYFICYMCSSCISYISVNILAVASLGTIRQIYSAKTKYINIVIYITMPIPRVVKTEIYRNIFM